VSQDHDVLVFIASYNDEACLHALIREIQTQDPRYRVLVIDDGSETSLDPKMEDVLFVRLPDNCGLGVCTLVAFDHMLRHGYSAAVRVDADGQHPVVAIPRLLEPIWQKKAAIVAGVRTNRGEGTGAGNIVRNAARSYYAVLARLVTRGSAPKDVNTGFFAVSPRAAETLRDFELDRYPEPEMYILACRSGLSVQEIMVKQRPRQQGQSTLGVGGAFRAFLHFNFFLLNELMGGARR